jgi:hypothetical protein
LQESEQSPRDVERAEDQLVVPGQPVWQVAVEVLAALVRETCARTKVMRSRFDFQEGVKKSQATA